MSGAQEEEAPEELVPEEGDRNRLLAYVERKYPGFLPGQMTLARALALKKAERRMRSYKGGRLPRRPASATGRSSVKKQQDWAKYYFGLMQMYRRQLKDWIQEAREIEEGLKTEGHIE